MKTSYEPGMKIAYEQVTHRVVVSFRGRITVLPNVAESEQAAITAGEQFCRQHGWKPERARAPGPQIRSLWR